MFLNAFWDLKNEIFGLKSGFWSLFWESEFFFKHSILIICNGGHFSFSNLFLNAAQYTLSAICAFFLVFTMVWFFKALLGKNIKIEVVGNVPGNIFFYFFPSSSRLAVFGRFPRQKWNFQGPKFWSKTQKKGSFFKLTNFPFWSILEQQSQLF